VSLEAYEENLAAIVHLAVGWGVPTVWTRTTPVDDERHNTRQSGFYRYNRDVLLYNEVADRVVRGAGFPLVDLYTLTRSLGDDVYVDHVHFVERVRALQAAFIAGHLFVLCN
jgi:hypothetical protein